jgi:hypothetical protein
MFRLIKLGIYAFIGYALYELYQGMVQQQGGGGNFSRAFGGSGGETAGERAFGRSQNLTAPARAGPRPLSTPTAAPSATMSAAA